MEKRKGNKRLWSENSLVYHIYPLSFKDSNGDGYGDIKGIIENLDHLAGKKESLGVDTVWLSPVQNSPMKDLGYDVSDYYDIDPTFGDMKAFKRLVEECHKRGLRIIIDLVPNHTSNLHPWFQESSSSKNDPKRDWYIWKDPSEKGGPPNNWISVFGGPAWTFDERTGQYYLHSFLPEQPDLNWRNKEVREEMGRILHHWLEIGVDGFRFDSVHYLMKDPLFRDDPPNKNYRDGTDDPYDSLVHVHSKGNIEVFETIRQLCEKLHGFGDRFMVSEVYLDIENLKKLYDAYPGNTHIPLNSNLINFPWKAQRYKEFIDRFEKTLTKKDIPNYVLGNHDWPRIVSRIGHERARVAAMMLLSLRGIAFIYQGEEIGLPDGEVPPDRSRDSMAKNKKTTREDRDPERTPMHWNKNKNAGFSEADETWLPVSPTYIEINVARQERDPKSMLNLYKCLIKLRKELSALREGRYKAIESPDEEVLVYSRQKGADQVMVVLNFSDTPKNISIEAQRGTLLCSTYMDRQKQEVDPKSIGLRENEGCLIDVS